MKRFAATLKYSRFVLCIYALCCACAAQSPAPVAYTIALTSPAQQLAQVQIPFPPGASQRDLHRPVWNALYQIRDFAQYVNWVRAKDRAGRELALHESDKSRWQIQGASAGAIVEYQIYIDSLGPFGAQLNDRHAFLNLAQILMYPVDERSAPARIHFAQIPAGWKIATPLDSSSGDIVAPNYDRLV